MGIATVPEKAAASLGELAPGMHHAAALGQDAAAMPGAALAWNAGGMGVHWTAATPWPVGDEVFGFGDPARWAEDLATASHVLAVAPRPFAPTAAGRVVLDGLAAALRGCGAALPRTAADAHGHRRDAVGPLAAHRARNHPPGGPSRIVDVTSSSILAMLQAGAPSFDEVEPAEYYGMAVSGRAKLAHLAYNRELAQRLRGSGVSVFAADPGAAATPNAAEMTPEILPPALRPHWEQIRQGVQRPAAEGARPVVFAATDPSLTGETGLIIDPECTPSETLLGALTPDLSAATRALTERVLKASQ